MITPVIPLLARLIHIRPSYWTIFRSFGIILEMGTVHWIAMFDTNPLLQKTFNPILILF